MSKTRNKFSPEVRDRTVRMVGEHRADYGSEWEAMTRPGSNCSSARSRNCGALTRLCARRRRILRWQSSTATANDGGVHRRPSRGLGYRANLP